MATRTATLTSSIEEPDGETTTASITREYDDSDDFKWDDIDFEYIASHNPGGPVMRPKKPR